MVVLLCGLVLTIRLARDPVVVLISVDGLAFAEMLNSTDFMPYLNKIRAGGVTAKLLPAFPSKSWPNHYTIITGEYPEHHGIVENKFYDPESGQMFWSEDDAKRVDPYWYKGMPFWKMVIDKQMKSACVQFPTCDVPHEGVLPTYLKSWDPSYPNYQRVQDIVSYVDLSSDKQPAFIAGCMSDVDDMEHVFGPYNVHVVQSLREVDNQLGTLYEALQSRSARYDIDLIIVSDHGFSKLVGRVFLDDYVNVTQFLIPELDAGATPQLSFWTQSPDMIPALMQSLQTVPNATAYLKADMPPRWHYNESDRIAPVHLIANEGFLITTRSYFLEHPNVFVGGGHGWDPDLPSMAGIFVGNGPSFKKPTSTNWPTIHNVDILNIMATILDIATPPNDGYSPYPPGLLVDRYDSLLSTPSPSS